MQAPLEPMQPPWTNACKPLDENRAAASAQLGPVDTTGQTGAQHVHRTSTLTGQTSDHDRLDRCATEPRNGSKSLENLSSNFSPLLTMHESSQKCKKNQPKASQIDKIQHRMLHMSK
jgi:hypothetical protein